jgi:cytochrome c6
MRYDLFIRHSTEGGSMKRITLLFLFFVILCSLTVAGVSAKEGSEESRGERLFMKHCSKCHPNGGNVVTVTKSLNPQDREANNVKTEKDIVRLMRHPGPGMVKFGKKVISGKDAKAIADYIMKTFK